VFLFYLFIIFIYYSHSFYFRVENQSLRSENDLLKRQLAGITATIKGSSLLSNLFSVGRSSSGSMFSGPKAAASACLLAVLCVFTFTTLMSSNNPIHTFNNSVSLSDFWSSTSQQAQLLEDSEASNPYAPKLLTLRRLLANESESISDCVLLSESGNQGEGESVNARIECVSIEDIFSANNDEAALGLNSIKRNIEITEQTIDKQIEL